MATCSTFNGSSSQVAFLQHVNSPEGFPGGTVIKNPPANIGDMGSIPGLGRPPGEGNGNPRQYSCLEIPWTEEPGGLESTGSQRLRHDRATEQQKSPDPL